jgi:hypothetical protein
LTIVLWIHGKFDRQTGMNPCCLKSSRVYEISALEQLKLLMTF